jgi:hypothetical protein
MISNECVRISGIGIAKERGGAWRRAIRRRRRRASYSIASLPRSRPTRSQGMKAFNDKKNIFSCCWFSLRKKFHWCLAPTSGWKPEKIPIGQRPYDVVAEGVLKAGEMADFAATNGSSPRPRNTSMTPMSSRPPNIGRPSERRANRPTRPARNQSATS